MDPTVTASRVVEYLSAYVGAYREAFRRFTAPPPEGAGYPARAISPYLTAGAVTCMIARDGSAIANFGWEPEYEWHIAGGPALMPDFEPTRVPPEIQELLRERGLLGKNIGISRIVPPSGEIPDEAWRGELPAPNNGAASMLDDGTTIEAYELDLDLADLISRLTFGAFGAILDIHVPGADRPFWTPLIIADIGFFPADRSARRFFHYLEIAPHVAPAAWDPRSVQVRVAADIRRDFASAPLEPGGQIRFAGPPPVSGLDPPTIATQIPRLAEAIAALRGGLAREPPPPENEMQALFEQYPLLLNVYGRISPRPRFSYPASGGPTSKAYVEPDFVVIEDLVSGPRYELIEIERPSKQLATRAGHSRVDLTQAAWQIGEWKAYISNHYDLLRDTYPGITRYRTAIIISRATEAAFGSAEIRGWMEIARAQLGVDEILLYDDVLRRAQSAYDRLVGTRAA